MLFDTFQRTRQLEHLWESLWVACCHIVFALGVGAYLWTSWNFEFQNTANIIGWVTVHKYPKQQEIVAYVGAFGFMILAVIGGWLHWCVLAQLFHHWRGYSISYSLHRTSWTFSGFMFSLIPLVRGQWTLTGLFFIPMGLFVLTGGILLLWRKQRSTWESDSLTGDASTEIKNFLPSKISVPEQFKLPIPSGRSEILFILFVIPLLLYLLLSLGQSIHQRLDLYHEGEQLAALNTLLRGGIPFRDIYIQHGLFQNIGKPWLSVLLNGPSVASLRFVETLLKPLAYLAVYFLGLQVFRSWFTALLLVLITSSNSFAVSDRSIFCLLSVTALVYAFRQTYSIRPHQSHDRHLLSMRCSIIGAGALSTFSFFYSTEMGLYAYATCGISLVIQGLSRGSLKPSQRLLMIIHYFGGALLAWIPFSLYFGLHNALGDLFKNTYDQCVYQIAAWGLPYPSLLAALQNTGSVADLGEFLQTTFRWYLPPIVYLITAGVLVFRAVRAHFWSKSSNAVMLPVLLLGIVQFRTALGRSDLPHLVMGSTVFWIFLLVFVESNMTLSIRCWREHEPFIRKATNSLLILLTFVMLGYLLNSPWARHWLVIEGNAQAQNSGVILDRLGGIQPAGKRLNQLRSIVDFIQQNTSAGEPIFDFSNQGAYYFLTGRPSATRYHNVAYAVTPAMQQEIIQDLEQTRAKLAIYSTGGWSDSIDGIPNCERHPLIARHLHAHYTKKVEISGAVILLR